MAELDWRCASWGCGQLPFGRSVQEQFEGVQVSRGVADGEDCEEEAGYVGDRAGQIGCGR